MHFEIDILKGFRLNWIFYLTILETLLEFIEILDFRVSEPFLGLRHKITDSRVLK